MLFDNEMYFESYDSRLDKEGFLKGNMFDGLYKPYKNMTYINPEVKTNKDKDLLDIMALSFAINDYNLYLDLHPDDNGIYQKFKTANNELKQKVENFEKNYGPLKLDYINSNKYLWSTSPWPWDKGDGMYV